MDKLTLLSNCHLLKAERALLLLRIAEQPSTAVYCFLFVLCCCVIEFATPKISCSARYECMLRQSTDNSTASG